MVGCPLWGLGNHLHVQSPADYAGDFSNWHALIADRVIFGSSGTLLNRQPEEMGGVESMHRGPAVEPVTHIRRNALLPRDADDCRNEAVVAVTVDSGRKPYHRHTDATRRHRSSCLFGGYARMRGIGCIFFGRKAALRDDDRGPRGDDQGSLRANQRGADSLDGAPIYLTVRRPLREVVDEGGVNDAVRSEEHTSEL